MNKYVVIDLETTGHSPETDDKIIELGLVVIEDDQIVDTYATLIHPNRSIPDFITHLTGITNDAVKEAPSFPEVAAKIINYFDDSYFVAHNVPFDLSFLNEALKQAGFDQLNNDRIDTVELSRILLPQASSFKLNDLAKLLNINHRDPHRALSDAYVTAKLFIQLKQKLASLPYETIKHLLTLEHLFHSNLKDILQDLLEKKAFVDTPSPLTTYKGLAIRKVKQTFKQPVEIEESFSQFSDQLYLGKNSLQQYIPTFEYRESQRQMSEYIYDSFQASRHLLIEAGTGTGKSLAYLIPALYEAILHNETIIISTHTTHLQTQLLMEAEKMLKNILDLPFQISLLKGKEHYISLERFLRSLEDEEDNYDIALTKAIILVWLTETTTGDVDEIRLPASGYSFYRTISAQADRNVYQAATPLGLSYYAQAREKARLSHIVIVNHALLCTDIKNNYEILPPYEKAIIDEAHHLVDVFSKTYGFQFNFLTIHHFLTHLNMTTMQNKWINYMLLKYRTTTNVGNCLQKWDGIFSQAIDEVDELFRQLYRFVKGNNEFNRTYNDVGRLQLILKQKYIQSNEWSTIKEFVERVLLLLNELKNMLLSIDEKVLDAIDRNDLKMHIDRLNDFIDAFEQLFLVSNLEKEVIWFEIDRASAENIVYIHCEPIESAPLLKEKFFNEKESVILTSATLTVRNSFSFIQKRLGLTEQSCDTYLLESPFTYADQVKLLIPKDFPHINNELDEFIYATCEAIISLAEMTKGRMLVLFTAYDMLRRCYYILKESMNSHDYTLIAQGVSSGSRTRLKKSFQTNDRTILLGTSSFWEGVDIPGDDLVALMIVRLPFEPPNEPIYAAKATALQRENKNPFFELALPKAVLRFKQGFGRLIRSKNDRGIVFVCDARIKTARYGQFFMRSIPEVPTVYDSTKSLIKFAEQWLD